jgi:hypothetical protein
MVNGLEGERMNETNLIKKLRLAASQKALVLNAPANYLQSLGELPAGVTLSTQPGGTFDFVQLFSKTRLNWRASARRPGGDL